MTDTTCGTCLRWKQWDSPSRYVMGRCQWDGYYVEGGYEVFTPEGHYCREWQSKVDPCHEHLKPFEKLCVHWEPSGWHAALGLSWGRCALTKQYRFGSGCPDHKPAKEGSK